MESKIKVYGHRRQLVNSSFACIPFSKACLERMSVWPPLQSAVRCFPSTCPEIHWRHRAFPGTPLYIGR